MTMMVWCGGGDGDGDGSGGDGGGSNDDRSRLVSTRRVFQRVYEKASECARAAASTNRKRASRRRAVEGGR